MRINKNKFIGIFVVVVSLSLILFMATRVESTVTFYTPAEIYENTQKFSGKRFRVSGLVVKGSKVWDGRNHTLDFRITDLSGHDFAVHYIGVPPDLFKEGQGVVVEGTLQENFSNTNIITSNNTPTQLPRIESSLLMVKHSEVYETKQDHSKMREAKLLDSLLKD